MPKAVLSSFLSDIQAYNLAKFVGSEWRILGHVFNLREYELSAVEQDRDTVQKRAHDVIHRWRMRVGRCVRIRQVLKDLQTEPELEYAAKLFAQYLKEKASH